MGDWMTAMTNTLLTTRYSSMLLLTTLVASAPVVVIKLLTINSVPGFDCFWTARWSASAMRKLSPFSAYSCSRMLFAVWFLSGRFNAQSTASPRSFMDLQLSSSAESCHRWQCSAIDAINGHRATVSGGSGQTFGADVGWTGNTRRHVQRHNVAGRGVHQGHHWKVLERPRVFVFSISFSYCFFPNTVFSVGSVPVRF